MEPIGGTASVLTLLAAAGGTCKFLYSTFSDLADAPRNIQACNAKLRRLDMSVQRLLQAYQKLPPDFALDEQLWDEFTRFKKEIDSFKTTIEAKGAKVKKSRRQAVRESCKWLLFDRHLTRFSESLDHWNQFLCQTAQATQVALSICIEEKTTMLLELAPSPAKDHASAPGACSIQPASVLHSATTLTHSTKILPCVSDVSPDSLERRELYSSQRLITYLSTVVDPVGMCLQHWSQISLGSFTVSCASGAAIVRTWSASGKEVYKRVSKARGYAVDVTLQNSRVIPGRFSISLTGLRPESHIAKITLHSNIQWVGLFDFGGRHHKAIERGDDSYLREVLTSRALRIHDSTDNGDTLLHLAAGHSQVHLIDFLLKSGANVNATNNNGDTPLHVALRVGRNYECARLLLAQGADACREDKEGRTPLHSFYNDAIGQIIRRHGEDIDTSSQDYRGMTALHWASWSSRSSPEEVACPPSSGTISRHLSPVLDMEGKSVLHFAVQRGNISVVQYLMSQAHAAELALPDFSGRTLLHYATASGRVHLIDFLIERKGFDPMVRDHQGRTLLHHAAMRDNLSAVKHLFELGIAQPDCLDKDGRTPLQVGLLYESTSVVEWLQVFHPVTTAKSESCKTDVAAATIGVRRIRTQKKLESVTLATLLLCLVSGYWYMLRTGTESKYWHRLIVKL